MSKYYTVKETANLLEISQYQIRKLIHTGRLMAERGPRRMFLIRDFVLYDYACRKLEYRRLLSSKIGWDFGCYMMMWDTVVLAWPSKYMQEKLKKIREKKRKLQKLEG
jgi:excisionase family DNA binding protein